MLLEYFGLNEQPFGVTPDPRFIHFGATHREALASLVYGIESNRGFVALIAKPGMGKTSLLYHFLEGMKNQARTAFVFQTDCHRRELLRHILTDLDLNATGKDLPAMHEMLNNLLVQEMGIGRKVILVIDEAQNLDKKALESIRLLTNFETPWTKLLQIVLAGQPQLADRLTDPSLAQLRQRISVIARIQPFTNEEIGKYIAHRLSVAGYKGPLLFTPGAQGMIAQHSEGIPRNVNNLCFGAMSLACAVKTKVIDRGIVSEVITDLDLRIDSDKSVITRSQDTIQSSAPKELPAKRRKASILTGFLRFAAVCVLLSVAIWFLEVRSSERQRLPLRMISHGSHSLATAGTGRNSDSEIDMTAVAAQARLREDILPRALFAEPKQSEMPISGRAEVQGLTSIRIQRGQTLYRLTVTKLGAYNSEVLRQMRLLNPWLVDPDHIQADRLIIMPFAPTQAGTKLPDNSSNMHLKAVAATKTPENKVRAPRVASLDFREEGEN